MFLPLRLLDDLLNKITSYKLIVWGLRILAGISMVFSFLGLLPLSTKGLLISLGILSMVCYLTNLVLSRAWRVATNTESYAITLLILFFVLPPVETLIDGLVVMVAGIIAIASKFLIAYRGKHIFNPAAFALSAVGILALTGSAWWVGSDVLLPFTLVLGLLVVRKIRRFSLFFAFTLVSLAVLTATALMEGQSILGNLKYMFLASPLIFLGTIMLTEPATMPARRQQQINFGALVGLLYATTWDIGLLTIYPEVALIIGNLYAFYVNPRYRLRLKLKEVQQISDRVANYVFTPDRKAEFVPGQYMEFTLDHTKHDGRGNRRTFSIASSPTEQDVQLGVKFYEPSSRFKQALRAMKPGDEIFAGQIAGDFILPTDKREKLVFIAAGIGVTPFRSMLKHLLDTKEQRDIVMIYAVLNADEIAYEGVLAKAEMSGVRIIGLLRSDSPPSWWQGSLGRLDARFVAEQIPDYKDRKIYLSGPNGMVQNVRADLLSSGVSRRQIKTDYFTGY